MPNGVCGTLYGGEGVFWALLLSLGDVFALRGSLLPSFGCHAFFQTLPCHALCSQSVWRSSTCCHATVKSPSQPGPATRCCFLGDVLRVASSKLPCHALCSHQVGFFHMAPATRSVFLHQPGHTAPRHVATRASHETFAGLLPLKWFLAPATRCLPITGLALPRSRFL